MTGRPDLTDPWYVLVVEGVRSGAAVGERRAPPARYQLERRETTIGRAPECTVRLDDMFVSRRHATLVLRDRELYLEDFDSTNESRVNGTPARTRVRVHPGDVLEFGRARCRVEAFGAAGEPGSGAAALAQDLPEQPPLSDQDSSADPGRSSAEGPAAPPAQTLPPTNMDQWSEFALPRAHVAGPLPGEPGRTRRRALVALLLVAAASAAAFWLLA